MVLILIMPPIVPFHLKLASGEGNWLKTLAKTICQSHSTPPLSCFAFPYFLIRIKYVSRLGQVAQLHSSPTKPKNVCLASEEGSWKLAGNYLFLMYNIGDPPKLQIHFKVVSFYSKRCSSTEQYRSSIQNCFP